MISPRQRVLLSTGKYRRIEDLQANDDVLDATGMSRQVRSIVPSDDYMGVVYVTTKKSMNRVDISRRNSILVVQREERKNKNKENNAGTRKQIDPNLIDDVYDVGMGIDFDYNFNSDSNFRFTSTSAYTSTIPLWIPVQNIIIGRHAVAPIDLTKNVSHSLSLFSYSQGFIMGAFLTSGCRKFNDKQTWSQFILDVRNPYFERKLLHCLVIVHSEELTDIMQKLSWGEKNIENSQIKKLNVFSICLEHLVRDVNESSRDLPEAFMTYGRECLRGIYDSLLHTNHYYSDNLVYDLCMYLECLFEDTNETLRKRGDFIEIAKEHPEGCGKTVNIVFTDTDENFTSLICDHIPIATFPNGGK